MILKKFLSIMTATTIFLCSFVFNGIVYASNPTIIETSAITNKRLYNVFEDQMDEMVSNSYKVSGISRDIEIESIFEISDFGGNKYTLIECSPTGYMIYHNDSGQFVESSPAIHSPFYEVEGNYKYIGPNEYYVTNDTSYKRILGEDITIIDSAITKELSEKSNKVNTLLKNNKNEYVLNYVNGTSDISLSQLYQMENKETSTRTVETNDWTLVKNYSFFMNLNNCGYITGGKCGYIAAGILLTYDKVTNGKNTVTANTHYTYSNGCYSIKTALPTALYEKGKSLGYGASTTSVAIHYTVKDWLADRGLEVDHTSLYTPFGNNNAICNKIDDDRPTIWFGNISENTHNSTTGNHAIVVYGYLDKSLTGCSYVAHFGWTNATEVYFTGILGSMYTYKWK